MKILLLNPPFKNGKFSRTSRSPAITKSGTLYYPIWLAYATGVLEEAGHEVRLIDAPARMYSKDECAHMAREFAPRLVVIDTSTPSIHSDAGMAELIRAGLKDAFIVLVGTHPSALPEETLRLSAAIDAVAVGEYDYTLKDLAEALGSGRDLSKVAGISFRREHEVVHNERRPLIEDLDSLPFVSKVYKKHLDIRDYFFAASFYPFVMIITGRGCPFGCSFCVYPQVFHSRKYRTRSPENIVSEFEHVAKMVPGVKEIGIEDDTFTVDRNRVKAVCGLIIKKGIKIKWYCDTRADLDYETMRLMKSAGCRLLIAGFESGSQEVLNNVHKGIRLDDMVRFAKDTKRAGLLLHGCFMAGNPGETKETLQKTLKFAKTLGCDTAQFFPLIAYPGTEVYNWAVERGYIRAKSFSDWLTDDGMHNAVLDTQDLTAQELVDFCNRARREFYLRPQYLFYKAARSLGDPNEFLRTLKSFRTFYKHLVKA